MNLTGTNWVNEMRLSNRIRVDVGELHVSNNPEHTLLTYALGSCIGLIVHDPVAKVGGLAHIQLPDLPLNCATENPEGVWAYAGRAVPELFQRVYALKGERRQLRIAIAGGASILDPQNYFQIGRKNYLSVKRLLWSAGHFVSAEAVGGTEWRTVRLEIGTGKLEIQTQKGKEVL